MERPLRWIQGDGGPAILLQAATVSRWEGARDFDISLMNGGSVETDYDVICRCDDSVNVIERYGRDMLVLSDSESPCGFVPSPDDRIIIVQRFPGEGEEEAVLGRLRTSIPSKTLRFNQQDGKLRLLVGADDGAGGMYGFLDAECRPGAKVCEVHNVDVWQVIVIRSA